MTRYPNSECEKHSNVVVSDPVCLLCLMDAIELLTKTNERQAAEIADLQARIDKWRKLAEETQANYVEKVTEMDCIIAVLRTDQNSLVDELATRREEVACLMDALGFYADLENWRGQYPVVKENLHLSLVFLDNGYRARKALDQTFPQTKYQDDSIPLHPVCRWEPDSFLEDDIWNTGCGDAVVFCDGSPVDNGYKYCHYCGKPIEYVEGGNP